MNFVKSIFKKLGGLLYGLTNLLIHPPETDIRMMEQKLKMYPYHYMG